MKTAQFVVESEGINPIPAFIYSSNEENVTKVAFEYGENIEVEFTRIFRASEHDFRAEKFHGHCDNQGPTIIFVRAETGLVAVFYNGVEWAETGVFGNKALNPKGFFASVDADPNGGYSLQKYGANDLAFVITDPEAGPSFGSGLDISGIVSCFLTM
jgi:hypothetical protein